MKLCVNTRNSKLENTPIPYRLELSHKERITVVLQGHSEGLRDTSSAEMSGSKVLR